MSTPYYSAGGMVSHDWTVRGWRLEVIYDENGLSVKWHSFSPEPSASNKFFGRFFYWWMTPFVAE